MRLTTELFFVLCYLILTLVSAKKTILKHNRTGVLRMGPGMNFLQEDPGAYPAPLPTPSQKISSLPSSTLYQGLRYKDDQRVFRQRFNHEAMLTGQQITCQGLFDCIISHIAIESTEAIPVLLRGGAGYRHFTAVVKAKPHRDLVGQVRAYCRNHYVPQEQPQRRLGVDTPRIKRRYDFENLLNDSV